MLLAFGILVLSKLSEQYTNTAIFEIEFKNTIDEEVVLNTNNKKLKLVLTGNGFKWFKYYVSKPKIVIDVNNDITKTDSEYIWTLNQGYATIKNQLDKTFKIISVTPETINFKYDLNAVKTVPIKANVNLSFKSGYDVFDGVTVQPDSVKVIGPASLLSKLEALETESLVLEDLNLSVKKELFLKLDSLDKQLIIPFKSVSVEAKIEKFTDGTLSVPIQLINVPKGVTIKPFPKQVLITYYTSLEKFNAISATDFNVVCDYNTLKNNNLYLIPKVVKQPTAAKSIRLHQQKIEFIISE